MSVIPMWMRPSSLAGGLKRKLPTGWPLRAGGGVGVGEGTGAGAGAGVATGAGGRVEVGAEGAGDREPHATKVAARTIVSAPRAPTSGSGRLTAPAHCEQRKPS